ncbi:hypothetical protein NKI94_08140 [Mesorhizobium australicum]|uniref:hypothetical protein n=1 Tax=Mesorhizobium australicum TaxID=536018 RepID=UPI00333D812D
MLQIVSGKFYTDEARRRNIMRGTLYSNMRLPWRCDRIETAAGALQPSTAFRGLRTLSYEIVEEYEGTEDTAVLLSIGVDPFLKDFASIASFALNVVCTPDPDLLRRLVGDQPLSPSTIASPRTYVGRVFDGEVHVTDEELDKLKDFVRDLIALKRTHYLSAIGAIRTYVTGLHRIGDDIDVAYTLLVASIESLAQKYKGASARWEDYDSPKRSTMDKALKGAPEEIGNRVRDALLEIEHVGLARRFRSFALENLAPTFFREEAQGQEYPAGKADLVGALARAYSIRSKYVHNLAPVPKLVSHVWHRGDLVNVGGKPVLTLHGLARLARHLIWVFVRSGQKVEKERYPYQDDFPNIVHVEFAPQYWVWKHEGFRPAAARQKLGGFLSLVSALQKKAPDAQLIDMRDLLRKYEALIPQAKAHRLPMVALYFLFNSFVKPADRLPDAQKFMDRYHSVLVSPSLEGIGVRFALKRDVEWPTEEVASLYSRYYKQKYEKPGLKLPELYETAFALTLAEAYRRDGKLAEAGETLFEAINNQPKASTLQSALATLKLNESAPISWQVLLLPEPPEVDRPPEAS